MRLPSGDQLGLVSHVESEGSAVVSARAPVPSALLTHSVAGQPLQDSPVASACEYAIWVPLGDQAGSVCWDVVRVSRCSPLPSGASV